MEVMPLIEILVETKDAEKRHTSGMSRSVSYGHINFLLLLSQDVYL